MVTATKQIELKPVESSNLSAVGYCPRTQTLRVRFKHSAELHDYSDFTPKRWEEMQRAPSIGGYFATAVRNHYPHSLVPRDDEAEHEGAAD